jgi:L-seryl-tRNA(Ser) seleniumtransferase
MSKAVSHSTISYKELPSVDEVLRSEIAADILESAGRERTTQLARLSVEQLRESIKNGSTADRQTLLSLAAGSMLSKWRSNQMMGMARIINATGVIIHTNLGRAPLSEAAREAMIAASGYTNLEYDLESGARGRRGARAEELLIELIGTEDALVVNNCAAAAFFILHVFARGGEVIISRGELVEIGGDFRVPDVLEQSGATLREVGTTNRTKLVDYENAFTKDTRMVLRVHPSNYRIVGFTATPNITELAAIARKHDILLYEDLGSGALVDLSGYGLNDEPVVTASIKNGADIISFSGDKLLGGPQCGIIAGKHELIEKLRKHPLQRALRVDKKTFAALEATLASYQKGTHFEDIPVLRQLSARATEISKRAEGLLERLGEQGALSFEVIDGASVIGGGAAPDIRPDTFLIAVSHPELSADAIERTLRFFRIPVITRIEDSRVLIDLRTIDPSDEQIVIEALSAVTAAL